MPKFENKRKLPSINVRFQGFDGLKKIMPNGRFGPVVLS
jgi:hypothetical protein